MRRSPLRYQASEYDCGPVAVVNAISCVCDFSDIPPAFLKTVYEVSLDKTNQTGHIGREGTSREAMEFIASWINQYNKKTGYPHIHCRIVKGDAVSLKEGSALLEEVRKENTVVLLFCQVYNEHYVVVTDCSDKYIYLFDSYDWDIDYGDKKIIRINEPYCANRKLPIGFMDDNEGIYYSIKNVEKFAIIFEKN